jgi:hypothetical protein
VVFSLLAGAFWSHCGAHAREFGRVGSSPHSAHSSSNIDPDLSCGQSIARLSIRLRPRRAFEMVQKACRNKAGSRRINVTIALRVLAMSKEALWHDEAQIVFRACHGDIEQPPLLLNLGGSSGAKIGWHAAVNNVEDEHRFPFLTVPAQKVKTPCKCSVSFAVPIPSSA